MSLIENKENIDYQIIKRNNIKYYIHSLITVGLMIVFYFIPPISTITPVGMKVLGVFLGLIYGWCFVEMLWPSILGLVMLGLSGYCTVTEAFSAGFVII